MTKLIKVGLDIGNSNVKGCVMSEKNVVLKEILIPSCVNYIADKKYLNFPDNTNTRYTQILDSALAHSDMITAIGDRALDIPNYQQFDVGSTSYKTNHQITTALLFGLIAETLGSESEVNVILAVSVPIVESKTYNLVDNYKKMLQGSHIVRIYSENGERDVTINVVIARVLNEGQAGFLGLLDTMDNKFRMTMQSLYTFLGEKANMVSTLEDFLIIDIGEGTTDLAVFRNKKFNTDYSYSVTKGYGTLLELAISNAEREGLTIESRKQLQNLLESTNARRKPQQDLWNRFMDVERKTYADELVETVLKTYGRQSFLDAIIFLGGGFSALTGYRMNNMGTVDMSNAYLFEHLNEVLAKNNKSASLIFGIPEPYSQSINKRGLVQVLTSLSI